MHAFTRRAVLGAGIAVAGGSGPLTSCSAPSSASDDSHGPRAGSGNAGAPAAAEPAPEGYVSPHGEEVAAAHQERGPVREIRLTATTTSLDLGAGTVRTWAYDDELPARPIRVTAGDTLAVRLANHLPHSTTVHWHGISLRNDMDGVPGVTQPSIKAGASFDYRFTVPDPGTYWFHPHSGVQLDRGLYAPLIVDDPREPLEYDEEWIVMLDDWVDGVDGSTPDEVLDELGGGMAGMHGMDDTGPGNGSGKGGRDDSGDDGDDGDGDDGPRPPRTGPSRILRGARSRLLGGDPGNVAYPYYLVNGRTPDDPRTFRAKPGDRVRIRIINAGGDTAFRVALGGHTMTVTHTDGFPVEHQRVDALLVGMGERYDVLVTLADGVFPLVALAEGKNVTGMALVRTGSGRAPKATVRPKELNGMIMTASQLRAADDVRLPSKKVDRVHRIELTGGMAKYNWAINGRAYDMRNPTAAPITVEEGQRVRLDFVNSTQMWHPMHLHGHTYQLGQTGPRKDTAIVLPKKKLSVVFDADNPGQWMLHCHNAYHGEAGMMALVAYRA